MGKKKGNARDKTGFWGNEDQWTEAFVPKEWVSDPTYNFTPFSVGPLVFDTDPVPRYLRLYVDNDGVANGPRVAVLSLPSDEQVSFTRETYVLQEQRRASDRSPTATEIDTAQRVYGVDISGMYVVDETTRSNDTPRIVAGSSIKDAVLFIEDANGPAPVQLGTGNDNRTFSNAVDVIYAGAGNDTIRGGGGKDALRGEAGNDQLSGDDGDDVLLGEAGNDTLYGGNSTNTIDHPNSPSGAEQLNGYDYLLGGSGDDKLYGQAGVDVLEGMSGNDTLDGGDGLDIILGGLGNDLILGGAGGSSVPEGLPEYLSGGEGNDTIYGGNDGDLLIGGVGDDLLYGEAGNDDLFGGDGSDLLDGGRGDDDLSGGTGNDTYIVDSSGDEVYDQAGTGLETVKSSVTWDLNKASPSNPDTEFYQVDNGIDYLILTGTNAISGYGNRVNNRIEGNSAANTLDGRLGADTLIGNGGDDIYVVDNINDKIVELPMTGTETVRASISWNLNISWNPTNFNQQNAQSGLDHLELTGTAAIDGTGNYLANRITGNAANNLLKGEAANDTLIGGGGNDTLIGGAGNDTLNGGTGADTFVFNALAEKIDRIEDFRYWENDKIQVSRSGFGASSTSQFSYNAATGALSFNGSQFATLGMGLSFIAAEDIVLV